MKTIGRRFALIALAVAWSVGRPNALQAQPSSPGDKPVGDLSALRAIASDAQRLARSGDIAQARARVEQMEIQWRLLQSKVKTVSPAKWKAVDAAIDRVERELRFWRVRRSDSAAALQALLDAIDSPT
jgi:hypothetical protein